MSNYIKSYTTYETTQLFGKSGVYTITNKINGKYYVGGAKCLYTRFRIHLGDLLSNTHYNSLLQRAVNKYGIENFEFEILEEYPFDITFDMEYWWIGQLDACNKEKGYNLNRYVHTRKGAVLSEETKRKISEKLKGRKIVEDVRLQTKKIIREMRGVCVIQLSLDGTFIKEWGCISEAAQTYGIHMQNIRASMNNTYGQSGGFIWVKKNEYSPHKKYSYVPKGRKVHMCSLSGEILAEFANLKLAADFVKGDQRGIRAVCNKIIRIDKNGMSHKHLTYKGYKWEYVK